MSKRISINIGYITNSSSVVHHFPRELLEHPKVAAFISTFEIEDGFVGEELWSRSHCTTFAVTQEQKTQVAKSFSGDNEYDAKGPAIDTKSDEVVVIYGDEYRSIATELCGILLKALAESTGNDEDRWMHGVDYN